ncbi:hypothetical protein LEMA_P019370.1 [Plenodomus lingam JN3]|uniref:Apple domain-containing protein n=1 Tax=Leptosphaeria maculans (strain JN3 / isolate v23.1.3 / race Av1-4-5-6-7-8) TaxID=985895 RepID=E5AAW6_LEPMJ|nr:hypothetical protein LEMA_P019370.1 [Plenodomus lingam JN3]CBY00807.1 hypothetical protein LEMA_P019370.1 [Plenodomus lingam JN3]
MLFPAFVAAAAAISTVAAQDVTASATDCTTRFGYYPLPTGTAGAAAVPTWYRYITSTHLFSLSSTVHDTVTATPDATTFVNVLTTTSTVTETTTSTEAPVVVPTPAGFINLLAVSTPVVTGSVSRVKREIAGRDSHELSLFKRQTALNHTGGYIVDRTGNATSLNRKFILRVDCRVTVNVNRTSISIVTGLPETVFLAPGTAVSLSTSTIRITQTVTEIQPAETIYQACQDNNIVNSITDRNGNTLIFDRVTYRPAQGFPIENELVVDKTSGRDCCIACQTTANCAGSFFVPSMQQCHLRLTQPPSAAPPALPAPSASAGLFLANGSYPTAYASGSGALLAPSSVVATPLPLSSVSAVALPLQHSNSTCSAGSLSLYLGTIQGQGDFPIEFALEFSNGPCGRLSVWPIPVDEALDNSLEFRGAKMI